MSSGENAPVSVGDVIAGKYRIERVLGTGGMGVVVAALHVQLDRRVAIKFLLPAALANAEVVQRFSREARAASKIQSEHVAHVIDVGELDTGAPYMVMEYLEGRDLATRIAEQGNLAVSEIARYVLEACEALAEAHVAGIVHRDLKPANLFLATRADKSTSTKVLDFGISKAAVGTGGITSTQAIMGSPYYMSPEQLMSAKHVDHRSDVWALGILIYEALVGSPPFVGDQMPEIVAQILQAPTPSVRAKRPEIPAEIDTVIATCTAKDPAARYASVAHLARALAPFVPGSERSVERISRVLNAPDTTEPAVASTPRVEEAVARSDAGKSAWGATQSAIPRRSSTPWIVGGIAALALIGGLVALKHSSGSAPARIDSSPPPIPSIAAMPQIPPIPSTPMAIAPLSDQAPLSTVAASAPSASSIPKTKSPTSPAHAVKSAAPPVAPVPTVPAVPADPLHMGIK
jgi:serine/threonine-protein kinase